MIDFEYTINGECIPKGRPRFTKKGYAYTPKKTREYETKVKTTLKAQGAKKSARPLKVDIEIHRGYLKSWSKKQRASAEQGKLYPITRPDLDNYIKSILDGADGVLFEDDSQIIELTARKVYNREPKVIIRVEEIK